MNNLKMSANTFPASKSPENNFSGGENNKPEYKIASAKWLVQNLIGSSIRNTETSSEILNKSLAINAFFLKNEQELQKLLDILEKTFPIESYKSLYLLEKDLLKIKNATTKNTLSISYLGASTPIGEVLCFFRSYTLLKKHAEYITAKYLPKLYEFKQIIENHRTQMETKKIALMALAKTLKVSFLEGTNGNKKNSTNGSRKII